jgi:hypothetical protein
MVRAATNEMILTVWELAYGLGLAAKGLALLGLALPQRPLSELNGLSIGRRNAELLSLRAQLFGQELRSVTSCPQCDEKVELEFRVDDIRCGQPPGRAAQDITLHLERGEVLIGVPTCRDLIEIEQLPTQAARRRELLRRCIRARRDDSKTAELSPADIQAVSARLVECEPQADVRIAADCPKCEHQWSTRFDIVAFLWQEVDAWAQRILSEVHTLASYYGWSEAEIVNMSSWRRQIYLEMVRQ